MSFDTSHILLDGLEYSSNRVIEGTAIHMSEFLCMFCDVRHVHNSSLIRMINSSFSNNSFIGNGLDVELAFGTDHYSLLDFTLYTSTNISILNSTVSNNAAWYDSAIAIDMEGNPLVNELYVRNLTVANNVMFSPIYYKKSTINCKGIGTIWIQDISVVNNSATGLLIQDSDIVFLGNVLLQANHGYNGGGVALYGKSKVSVTDNTVLHFEDNVAENVGGGLYTQLGVQSRTHCFLILFGTIEFRNNSAKKAGRDWYGGHLDTCFSSMQQQYLAGIEMTSDPWHVCDCTRNSEDCINVVCTIHRVQTYPGQLFNLSLIAVGTVLNTETLSGVPSAIYAGLLPLKSSNPGRVSNDSLVHAEKRDCSELSYRIISTNQQEVMVLSTEDNINKIPDYYLSIWKLSLQQWHRLVKERESTVPAYVEIELLPCPLGFESPAGECTCSDFLKDYDVNCSIDTMLITRKPNIWLSSEQDVNSSILFLAHQHCPFDYCKPCDVAFSLDSPDAQCSGHHSGILCGRCKPGYSLTLGKSECRQCTNLYLLLLIPFALAGVLFIVFLSLTDMTVTAGTINGLLFFANIVRENHATFFPPQAAGSFLSVFIAWLNLDVGITTCFYDGLDSYIFMWLQFSFPIYIWFLAFSIIIASRHVNFVSKLCGRNIVPVLATLFLLSYTKLQRTISASLSFTVVDVSNGDKYFVWLEDGNVRYLQGKHIPLFLVSMLFLCF